MSPPGAFLLKSFSRFPPIKTSYFSGRSASHSMGSMGFSSFEDGSFRKFQTLMFSVHRGSSHIPFYTSTNQDNIKGYHSLVSTPSQNCAACGDLFCRESPITRHYGDANMWHGEESIGSFEEEMPRVSKTKKLTAKRKFGIVSKNFTGERYTTTLWEDS